MTAKNYIITHYPLTSEYLNSLREHIDDKPEQVVVSNVTANSYLSIIKFFRSLRADVLYLPIVDDASRAILPLIKILSLITPASKRLEVRPDFSIHEVTFQDGITIIRKLFVSTLFGSFHLFLDWLWLSRNYPKRRVDIFDNGLGRVIYMKTNLWLGVQAGGSVAHTNGVIGALLDKGYEVDLVMTDDPINTPDNNRLGLIHVNPPTNYVIPREINHSIHNAKFIADMVKLWPVRYNFIYQRLSRGSFAGVYLSRLRRLPLVIEYNGSEVWLARNWGKALFLEGFSNKLELACLRHAHLIITVSDVLRNELIARGVEPERIISYPNGVNPRQFSPERYSSKQIIEFKKSLGLDAGSKVITFIGTFGLWHGVEVLAIALRQLALENPEWLRKNKVHVLFIGEGVKRKEVEAILGIPELRPYYTLTGLVAQNEAPLYLAASDILVSPHVKNPDGSRFFGSPTKLFEYLSSARAVVASNLDQIGDVLNSCPLASTLTEGSAPPIGKACGVLFEPGDSGGLAKALIFLVENSEWCHKAGENGRKLALSNYTWGHHVDAFLGQLKILTGPSTKKEMPIRILINALHAKTGGGVTYLKNMLHLLAEDQEVEVHLCIHESQFSLLPDNIENIHIHTLFFKSSFWELQKREQLDIPKLAKAINSDVVFSPANYAPLGVTNSVILLRNALSVGLIERRLDKIFYWILVYLGTTFSLIFCKRAIAVSSFAKNSIGSGHLRLLKGKIDVIPHGVSNIYSPSEDPFSRDDFLLAVSDIYVQKNLENLICSIGLLRERNPDVLLKIAGHPVDEDYKSHLDDLVARNNLGRNIDFLGHVESQNLVELYRRCAVFVFPSSVETFGNPLVEAMACGTPIVSSKTAAMPEIMGSAALYFDPGLPEEIANTITKVLNDRKLRDRLIRASMKRARFFSWPLTAMETLQVLKCAAWKGAA